MEPHPEVLVQDDITWRIPDQILFAMLYEAFRGERPEFIMLRFFANLPHDDQ